MEQEFLLKYYGGYSTFELIFKPAEERAWLIERINKEIQAQNEVRNPSPKGAPGVNFK